MNNLKVWLMFGFFLCFMACTGDKAANTRDLLTGIWTVDSAKRNGKPINTLENVFFEFDETGQMTSNLPLSTKTTEYTVLYEVKKNNIVYSVDEVEYNLQIAQLSDSLIVNTNLHNTPFQMVLIRQSGTESGE